MLEVLFEHRDATLRKRDKHKKKKDYYDSLLDLLHDLEEVEDSNLVNLRDIQCIVGCKQSIMIINTSLKHWTPDIITCKQILICYYRIQLEIKRCRVHLYIII